MRGMGFYVGLDLGQSADFTALAIVQDVQERDEETQRLVRRLHLRHLERYPHHTPYTSIADGVVALMSDPRLWSNRKPPRLVVDNTGVGRAVTDLLKSNGLRFTSVTITGGDKANRAEGGTWRVPKRDLVAALEVPFHTGTLKVAESLELWPTLKGELQSFRRKVNLKTAHDSYEHWRESDHDDLVLATALACWEITRPKSVLRLVR
jgi:hypothetical protein